MGAYPAPARIGSFALIEQKGPAAARREGVRKVEQLANGPGKLTHALGITRAHNGVDVTRGSLVVRQSPGAGEIEIAVTPRIGITRSAELPLRFLIADNRFVSAGRYNEPSLR